MPLYQNPRTDLRYPLASIYDRYFPPPSTPDERTFEDVARESGGYAGPPTEPQFNLNAVRNLLANLKIPQEMATGVGVEGMQFPEQPRIASVSREPREVGLAGVMEQPQTNAPEGWQSAPGGRYRTEKPPFYALRTPEGLQADEAANSLRAFTAAKYGEGRYGGAANFLNPLEAAGESRIRTAQTLARRYPQFSVDDIFKQIVELPTTELQGQMAGPLKELAAIDEQERQRRENAWLLQVIGGGRVGATPGGGISPETLKRGTQAIEANRADERLRLSEDRLAGIERRERLARPNEAALAGRAQRILAEKGFTAKHIEGTWYVYKGSNSRTPIANSEQAWAAAQKRAEAELRSGAP